MTVLNTRNLTQESQSRAATVLNQFTLPDEALSRADTILNTRAAAGSDANSRAVTVCDVGDLNNNGQLDLGDIELFVAALLDPNANLNQTWAADLNCDLVTDGLDIQAFIEAIVN